MRFLIVLALTAVLAACASGRDFARPFASDLALGTMTEADIVGRYGPPTKRLQATMAQPTAAQLAATRGSFDHMPAAGTLVRLDYYFDEPEGYGRRGFKDLSFYVLDGKLVRYEFVSNSAATSTKFDESRIGEIKRGVTTRAQLSAMFGEPAGLGIYPTIRDRGAVLVIYSFIDFDKGEFLNRKNDLITSFLEVLVGPDDKVVDFRARSETKALPPEPAPATVPMPIFIPTK